jgi:hypothetical protein
MMLDDISVRPSSVTTFRPDLEPEFSVPFNPDEPDFSSPFPPETGFPVETNGSEIVRNNETGLIDFGQAVRNEQGQVKIS